MQRLDLLPQQTYFFLQGDQSLGVVRLLSLHRAQTETVEGFDHVAQRSDEMHVQVTLLGRQRVDVNANFLVDSAAHRKPGVANDRRSPTESLVDGDSTTDRPRLVKTPVNVLGERVSLAGDHATGRWRRGTCRRGY